MTVTLVVGNPKPASRTRAAGLALSRSLTGSNPGNVLELSELGTNLVKGSGDAVAAAVNTVQNSSICIFASPTFKATYTGLLKLFLEQFEGGTGLRDVIAIPLMLGASRDHALAPEFGLRPLLTELGGTCALPGLYLIDKTFSQDGELELYSARWGPVLSALASPSS